MKNRKIATLALTASLLGGTAIGSFVAPPMAAFAADASTQSTANATARTPGQWVTDSLKSLVDKGTITQSQSDAVADALKSAEPQRDHGPGGRPGARLDDTKLADLLGISQSDLRTALKTKSLADLAKEHNVDVQKVIDTLVTAESDHLTKEVTQGHLTQAEADQRKAGSVDRATRVVNNVLPTEKTDKVGPGGQNGPRHVSPGDPSDQDDNGDFDNGDLESTNATPPAAS